MDESQRWQKRVGAARQSVYPTMTKLPQVYPMSGSLGPYELVCELGSGGMGTVYAARRCYPGNITRTVVVKTLRSDLLLRKDLVALFLNEARLVAKLHHRSVCAVTDVGLVEGIPYVAMEYLVGEPLSRLIPLMAQARGETSVAATVRIIADLCEGLHAAHELKDPDGRALGLVHRDISPDNLFVLYDGTVRLMDFGIALTTELQDSGKTGGLAGKCAYMSPQQLRCERLDRRTDIWSMGVVLWEMLTGKRLFSRATDVRTASAALTLQITAPSSLNELVPPNLDAVVLRALARDLEQRYSNARELANALHTVLSTTLIPMSAAKVGKFVDALFPGRQDFWLKIVPHSREIVQDSGPVTVPPDLFNSSQLEFDPMVHGIPDVRVLGLAEEREPSTFDPAAALAQADEKQLSPQPEVRKEARETAATRLAEPAQAELKAATDAQPGKSLPGRRVAWLLAISSAAVLGVALFTRFTSPPASTQLRRAPERASQRPARSASVQHGPRDHAASTPAPVQAAAPTSTAPTNEPGRTEALAPNAASDLGGPAPAQRPQATKSEAKPRPAQQGTIHVSTRRNDVFVLVAGTPVRAPTPLKLPAGKQTITVLPGRDPARHIQVQIDPKRPLVIEIE